MKVDDLISFLDDIKDSGQNFFIEAEAKLDRAERFIEDYNSKYSPSISITSDGIIEMKNNKNKWGLELRLYVDTCPDEIKNTFGFNRNKHFRTEYNFRMNNNEVIYALFDHGFRIGLN